ncbi:hypothetical protein NDU88_003718 [Pleurodeles waltl]|uniref:Uncharacterized protein n=1 Tax=Pleurodeles waltl TaxID=8319 RepID=A0AAV7UGY9_PLEWA|nr:hypothetical protein NDU88_003718 [Pleurodeles waltl]
MYRPPYHDPPIRHLFRGGSTADKNTAETDYERENAHLHILHVRFRQYGTRVAGHPRTPIPAPVPGAHPAARKTSRSGAGDGGAQFSGSCLEGPSSAVLALKGPVQRFLRRRSPAERCWIRRGPVQRFLP